jgi:hypothetical protein
VNSFTALFRRIRPSLAAAFASLDTRPPADDGAAPQLDRLTTAAPSLRAARPPSEPRWYADRPGAYLADELPAPQGSHEVHAPRRGSSVLAERLAASGVRIPELVHAPIAARSRSGEPVAAVGALPEATRGDRQMSRLIAQARAHVRKGDWLRYRDTRLEMAVLQRRRGELVEALALYLDVWYLDLNGPRDSLGADSGALLGTEDPPFDPSRAALRSPSRRAVRKIMNALDLMPSHVQPLFRDAVASTHQTLGLPLSPAQAWLRIGPELLF